MSVNRLDLALALADLVYANRQLRNATQRRYGPGYAHLIRCRTLQQNAEKRAQGLVDLMIWEKQECDRYPSKSGC